MKSTHLSTGSRTVIGILAFLLIYSFARGFYPKPIEEQKKTVARSIVKTFTKNSKQLEQAVWGHFLVRLYRLSGDQKYIPGIRVFAEDLAGRLREHAGHLEDGQYIQAMEERFLRLPEKPLIKHIYRANLRRQWPGMAFLHRLIFLAVQIKSFNMHTGDLSRDFEKIVEHIKNAGYYEYLMSEDMIRYNSTRMVNMVYHLKFLGLENYEKEFTEKFKTVFFADAARDQDPTFYLNKIYGLTHFVIAASNYYQQKVPYQEFEWILTYFEQEIDRLIDKGNADMIAEAVVCFKLAGIDEHDVIEKAHQYLIGQFDAGRGLIPGTRKGADLNALEHRNILSFMALANWKTLFPGPDLGARQR